MSLPARQENALDPVKEWSGDTDPGLLCGWLLGLECCHSVTQTCHFVLLYGVPSHQMHKGTKVSQETRLVGLLAA